MTQAIGQTHAIGENAGQSDCPLCGRKTSECRPCVPGRVKCACGMVFRPSANLRVSESQFWDSGDYADPAWVERVYGGRREQANRELVEAVTRLVRGGRWLDVGCGPGYLIRAARKAGWHASGIDLSRRAVALAQDAGLDAVCGDFPSQAPEGSYDVISLIHALEYVSHPKLIVRECRNRLRRGGLLVVQSKNFSFWSRAERFFRSGSGIWCPQDIRSYSPTTMTRLLRISGFETITIRPARLTNHPVLTGCLACLSTLGGPLLSPSMTAIARAEAAKGEAQ